MADGVQLLDKDTEMSDMELEFTCFDLIEIEFPDVTKLGFDRIGYEITKVHPETRAHAKGVTKEWTIRAIGGNLISMNPGNQSEAQINNLIKQASEKNLTQKIMFSIDPIMEDNSRETKEKSYKLVFAGEISDLDIALAVLKELNSIYLDRTGWYEWAEGRELLKIIEKVYKDSASTAAHPMKSSSNRTTIERLNHSSLDKSFEVGDHVQLKGLAQYPEYAKYNGKTGEIIEIKSYGPPQYTGTGSQVRYMGCMVEIDEKFITIQRNVANYLSKCPSVPGDGRKSGLAQSGHPGQG